MLHKNKLARLAVLAIALVSAFAFSGAGVAVSAATTREYGVDWSKYQGNYGRYGTAKDKFVIAQVGGVYNTAGYVDQATYRSQVSSAIAAGKRAHTYIWYQVGGSTAVAKAALDRFLPRVQTPKGSIVALDYEAGASGNKQANTNAIIYGMQRVKAAGYTPVLYSGKYYLNANVYYNQINSAFPTSLWIAGYPLSGIQTVAPFNYFPSYQGIAIWQFTSSYGASGIDGNVDLTGITHNGYDGSYKTDSGKVVVKPSTSTPAISAGQAANSTAKSSISKGYEVKVNMGATNWSNGAAIPSWVRGRTYHVIQTSGNKVLLGDGIMSWIDKSNIEILATNKQVTATSKDIDYAQSGKFSPSVTVNVRTGMGNQYRITGQLHKGNAIHYNHVYIKGNLVWARYNAYSGVRYVALGVNGGQSYGSRNGLSVASSYTVKHTYYTVKAGDSFWSIGHKYGISMYTLAARNGVSVNHVIHPGQHLLIK